MADYKKIISKQPAHSSKGLFLPEEDQQELLRSRTRFEWININKIHQEERLADVSKEKEFLKKHGQIQPLIVIPETEEKERFGTIVQSKTGSYRLIDGQRQYQALCELLEETKKKEYALSQAIVLSSDISLQEQQEIIQQLKAERERTVEETIQTTQGKEIELCYDFEEVRLRPEELQFEYNTFQFTQEEVEALSESILRFGMWDLPLILPKIEEGQLKYQIIAGHKRITAVLLIKEKARNQEYPGDNEEILQRLETIKVRLLPLGATQQQIEAVHEYSNLMRRQLTVEQGLQHINMIPSLPPVPQSQEEYDQFVENYSIQSLVRLTESYFKGLGWNNWKDRKTNRFLTVYYFGCEQAKEEFAKEHSAINQKNLLWIVTHYKNFDEREEQAYVLQRSLEDPTYLEEKKSYATQKRKQAIGNNYETIQKTLIRQREQIRKWLINGIHTTPDENEKIRKTIDELKSEIEKLEANCRLF